MNKINRKILEDIDILSKAMEKNNLCEVKFSDESISYELKKHPKHQIINNSDLNAAENKPVIEKKVNLAENALKRLRFDLPFDASGHQHPQKDDLGTTRKLLKN